MPVAALPQPFRGTTDARAFLRRQAAEAASPRAWTARPHFHDQDRALFARDDVDLEPTDPQVRRDDRGAGSNQVPDDERFGALAESVRASDFIGRGSAGCAAGAQEPRPAGCFGPQPFGGGSVATVGGS